MTVSAPTQLASVNAAASSATTGSINPTDNEMAFAMAVAASDTAAVTAPASPAGTFTPSTAWAAINSIVLTGGGLSIGIKVWWTPDSGTGTGTVGSGTWTNATLASITVGECISDGALSLVDANGGTSSGTDGTNSASYTGDGTEDIAFYWNAAGYTTFTFTPVTGATEVAENVGNGNLYDTSWGYDLTSTILTTIGATHAAPTHRVCVVAGFAEAGGGGGGTFTQTVGMVPILVA